MVKLSGCCWWRWPLNVKVKFRHCKSYTSAHWWWSASYGQMRRWLLKKETVCECSSTYNVVTTDTCAASCSHTSLLRRRSWAAPGRGGGEHVFAPSCPPSGKILMVIKCPLVTMHMPMCDLLNVFFASHHRYPISSCVSKY